jgi:hypothetical protein
VMERVAQPALIAVAATTDGVTACPEGFFDDRVNCEVGSFGASLSPLCPAPGAAFAPVGAIAFGIEGFGRIACGCG